MVIAVYVLIGLVAFASGLALVAVVTVALIREVRLTFETLVGRSVAPAPVQPPQEVPGGFYDQDLTPEKVPDWEHWGE